MTGDPANPGVWGSINPALDDIVFREPLLHQARVDAVRPFDQALSDGGEQPIRVVVVSMGEKYVMQGNHRVLGAQWDGLHSVGAWVYTPEQWEAYTGMPFTPGGTNNPAILP